MLNNFNGKPPVARVLLYIRCYDRKTTNTRRLRENETSKNSPDKPVKDRFFGELDALDSCIWCLENKKISCVIGFVLTSRFGHMYTLKLASIKAASLF